MGQLKASFQTLICSLNAGELQSLILQLSKNDTSLSNRIIGMIQQLSPHTNVPSAPQWDPNEILEQAQFILHPGGMDRCDNYEMETAGDAYYDLLLSLQGMFRVIPNVQIILILQGLTKLVADDIDRIMGGCDEGLPWQSVAEQLGKYWCRVASCKDLQDGDHRSVLDLLSQWVPQLANYGLDQPFYSAMRTLQRRCTT